MLQEVKCLSVSACVAGACLWLVGQRDAAQATCRRRLATSRPTTGTAVHLMRSLVSEGCRLMCGFPALMPCRKAVELARSVDPASVIALEEEWGDWLSSQQQRDAAIDHYIEAGCTIKAVEAAIEDRQCVKAAGLVEFLQPAEAAPYYRRIAQLYEEANNRCAVTADTYVASGLHYSCEVCVACKPLACISAGPSCSR